MAFSRAGYLQNSQEVWLKGLELYFYLLLIFSNLAEVSLAHEGCACLLRRIAGVIGRGGLAWGTQVPKHYCQPDPSQRLDLCPPPPPIHPPWDFSFASALLYSVARGADLAASPLQPVHLPTEAWLSSTQVPRARRSPAALLPGEKGTDIHTLPRCRRAWAWSSGREALAPAGGAPGTRVLCPQRCGLPLRPPLISLKASLLRPRPQLHRSHREDQRVTGKRTPHQM